MAKNKDVTDANPETPPPPPGPDEAPIPGQLSTGITISTIVDGPGDVRTADVTLELALLHELDEAAQETYAVYSDRLIEQGALQVTPWPGLSESFKSAWRAAVKHVRDQETLHAGS